MNTITFQDGTVYDCGSFDTLAGYAQRYVDAGVDAQCVVGRKAMTAQEVVAEHHRRIEAWRARREQTHKPIRVLHGSSAGCYVTKWVRR